MKMTILTLAAALSLAGAAFGNHEPGHKVLVLKNKEGAAILGYDAVAYFTDNKAQKGSPKFVSEYEGAKYLFVSAEHKALFDKEPMKYSTLTTCVLNKIATQLHKEMKKAMRTLLSNKASTEIKH